MFTVPRVPPRGGVLLTAVAVLLSASCSTDSDTVDSTAWNDRPVAELVAILADPAAATDCELSLYPLLTCGYAATSAAEALGEAGDPVAVPALAAAAQDPETYHDTVEASWVALEMIGGPEVITALVAVITLAHPPTGQGAEASDDQQRGHQLDAADRAAGILGRLGGVEHNQLLAEAGSTISGCTHSGYLDALVEINRADATLLLPYLQDPRTDWVYGPLIVIGQPDTETALVAAIDEVGTTDIAECFLNSGNPVLEQAAEAWAAAHGFMITRLPVGGSPGWGSADSGGTH